MLGERRSRAGWCADLSEAFKNPDVEETEAATEREQKEEKGRLPENRPCTGKEPGRMKSSDLFFASGESRDFSSVLREVQGYLSKEYSGLVTAGGSDEVKAQIRRFAGKYIQDHRICVAGMGTEELIDAIYSEMAEFGFLTKYVYGEGIEEIDINAWDDVEVQFSGGETRKLEEHFESPEHAVNVVRRMLHVSGMVLDDASPSVLGHLAKNIRIAVLKTPVVDEDVGVAASIRIVNPQNMKKEDFIDGGTATEEMLDFLAECIRYGISVCVAGATSSGKTTLLGWLLTTIPDNKRIYSIENGSRELALVRRKEGRVVNSVIHTLTRDSENERQRIDQTALLDMALRFNPDIIVVGEMRGPEANAAQEAARTGVAVVTTIHSMSCDATYRRMVSLCKRAVEMRDETLMGFVTEAYPIVAFCKQLENKERRLMEIMECEILPDGTRSFRPLFEYQIEENRIENGKFIVKGSHRRVNAISDSLRRRLMENGMPQEMLVRLAAPLNGRKGQKKMIAIETLACAGLVTGLFLLLNLNISEFTEGLFDSFIHPRQGIREKIRESTGKRKKGILRREILEAQEVLELTGRGERFSMVCAVSLILFLIGAVLAGLLGSLLLAPVLASGFLFLPFWYVKLTAHHYKRDVSAELETALSVITTAYLRTEDIVTAVEENISYLNPPVSEVFGAFLMQVRMVDPDIDAALHTMKRRIDNEVFGEWCDALSDCQRDRSLKTTLVPIVSKLSDMRNVNAELEYLIAEPRKEFLIMVIFVVGNIPLMYLLNKEWYGVLMHTVLGQVILAGTAAAIFISAGFVVKLTRPIEYRR